MTFTPIRLIFARSVPQVSRLIVLHDESAADGNLIPDLCKPVQGVKLAVDNLIRVGQETCATTTDDRLRADMPHALERVNHASASLINAAQTLKHEPCSSRGRQMLIEGARCNRRETTRASRTYLFSDV